MHRSCDRPSSPQDPRGRPHGARAPRGSPWRSVAAVALVAARVRLVAPRRPRRSPPTTTTTSAPSTTTTAAPRRPAPRPPRPRHADAARRRTRRPRRPPSSTACSIDGWSRSAPRATPSRRRSSASRGRGQLDPALLHARLLLLQPGQPRRERQLLPGRQQRRGHRHRAEHGELRRLGDPHPDAGHGHQRQHPAGSRRPRWRGPQLQPARRERQA